VLDGVNQKQLIDAQSRDELDSGFSIFKPNRTGTRTKTDINKKSETEPNQERNFFIFD
jgi:hypothetical protein